ncbi:MAG: hypothetical protein WBQ26_12485 [Gemmatimonadaceae bacterium]
MEQLYWIARWIVDYDLLTANAAHDAVSEASASRAQPLDGCGEIVDFDREAVPATGLLMCAVRHRLAPTGCRVGCAEDEAKVTSGEHRKRWSRVHLERET